MTEPSSSSMPTRPLLLAAVRTEGDTVVVMSPLARVEHRCVGADQARDLAGDLAQLDGTRRAEELPEAESIPDFARLVGELAAAGLCVEAGQAWRFHQGMARNFPPVAPENPAAAAALPPWAPPRAGEDAPPEEDLAPPASTTLDRLARIRRSPPLTGTDPTQGEALSRHAIELAAATMWVHDDGHRSFGSGGGLWPLQMWVLERLPAGAGDGVSAGHDGLVGAGRRLALVDGGRRSVRRYGVVDPAHLAALVCYVPGAMQALRDGAGLILITADPRRTTGKYGNRGLNLMLFEAGAAAHHLALLAAEAGVGVRQFAGFAEEAVVRILPDQTVIPLLSVFVLTEGRPD